MSCCVSNGTPCIYVLQVVHSLGTMAKLRLTEYEYEGMTFMKEAFPSWALDEIKETLLDDSDVMVATYAKCGEIFS